MSDDTVHAFLAWAEHDRNRSPHTLRRYRAVLDQIPDPAHATLTDIETWWASRYDKSPGTRANELACLRSFYRYLTKFDHRADDPTRRLDAPKVDNAFPNPIGRTDLARALTACDERDAPDLRRAIALGAYGGLRVSEAAALDWRNVNLDTRILRVRGKGRKERIAGLSPKLRDEILPALPAGNVVTAGGHTYTADALQRRVNRFLTSLGIDATFHKLRGRYVTQAISETGDIYAVARAVGWASIETAKSYAALSDDALHRIAAAASR
jgi:integrase/recombinase XerD